MSHFCRHLKVKRVIIVLFWKINRYCYHSQANDLANEIFERLGLDKAADVDKARKRLPGAIMDRLAHKHLQARRSWPGDGKDTKKREFPPLFVKFVRNLLRTCGETDIGKKMDKRISVNI